MAQEINFDNYNDMISALNDFISKVSDACDEMEAAGNDCVANMNGDVASEKSNAKLATCVAMFRETLETAQGVISAMEEEMEEAAAVAAKIDDLD